MMSFRILSISGLHMVYSVAGAVVVWCVVLQALLLYSVWCCRHCGYAMHSVVGTVIRIR
jgi:hypothetical protein